MGAFDNYKPPSQAAPTGDVGGAFSGYKPPQPAATTAPSVPLYSFGGTGNDKIGEFLAKAGDTATFGLGAKLQDALGIGQRDGQTVAQQVEAGGKDIGPIASAGADVLGYAVGPGMAGVGAGLGKLAGAQLVRGVGENVASRVGGRMIGSGIEGTGATILGAAGHDQELTPGELLRSAAVSAATGALPGGAGKRPTTPPQAALDATTQGAFAPLKSKVYQAPGVSNVIDRTTSGMSAGDAMTMGQKLRDARDVMAREVADRPTITADDVAKFNRELGTAAGGSDERQRIAQQYVAALNRGVGSRTAADIAAANRASNIAKTNAEIGNWAADPSGAPKAVKSALADNPDFYKAQPGLFDALNAIGKKAPSSEPSISSEVGKAVGKHLLGAGIGLGTGYVLGNNPYGDLATTAVGALAPAALGKLRAIPTQNALLAAQHLNATGMKVDPGVYMNPLLQGFGMLARQGGYAAGSSGAF